MSDVITNNLDLWTSALLSKSTVGRGSNGKIEAYGIKKLRELILELAVRGKLVPQDPNDEPASELLKRIQAEKDGLIATGIIKKVKPLPPITDEEKLFDLPNGWANSNLGDVVEIVRGITFPGSEKSKIPEKGRIACLRTSNVQDHIEWDDLLYIREEFVSREDQFLKPQDIVMSMANSRDLVGKVALVGEKLNQKTSFGGFLGVLRPFLIDPRFVVTLLRTPRTRKKLIDSASQTTNIANISLGKLRPLFFAIPPLAEQHRIVDKVDELMALCDQLEQQQTDSIETHQTLVETLLGTLTSAASHEEFDAAWTRIADHFDILFTTEHSIDQLKQTILQLAVMGKLVPQDPDDEPARELLERIAEEKKQFVDEGKYKKQKTLPEIADFEVPFKLPTGWAWLRFGEMGEIIGGGTPSKSNQRFWNGQIPWVSPKDMKEDFISETIDTISEEAVEGSAVKTIPAGSLLVVVRGMILAHSFPVAITRVPLTVNQDMKAIVIDGLDKNYVLLMVKALKNDFVAMVDRSTHGTCKLVSEKLWAKVLPIPPSDEQHRIVAKVDELMAVCDALKAHLSDAQTTQIHLAEDIVGQAVA